MIRRIPQQETLSKTVLSFCQQLAKYKIRGESFAGDIDTSYATRVTLSSDNSIYQALPQAVLFPTSTEDLLLITELANQQEFTQIRFSPRGGGTGTNGQSLTEHVIIDMSRHMREIIEINPEERWVRVQSGVIKDQLNDFLRPYGFFFAPDLSTSNRATIGGMINTDASGQGSLVYGKTSDHVLGLKAVTVGGELLNTQRVAIQDAQELSKSGSVLGQITQQVLKTCTEHRDEILRVFPRLNRFLTGYDLENVFDEELSTFDLSRILTGSEGTLALISEAKLNITPIAKYKTLINIKYDSFDSALRNSPFLVEANATSVETVDSTVLNLAKQDVVWDTVSHLITAIPNKNMDGLNIVEFNDEDAVQQETKIQALCQRLDELIDKNEAGLIGYQVVEDLADINKIYGMRKKAVGLLGNAKGNKKPIAFAEDTAVPPENLADFIVEFRQLLDSYNLNYGMFGHVDAGVLHVRPALDLSDPKQEQLMRTISDEVVKLTAKYGGLMWGEHGKGYRSEYGPAFFGENLFLEVRKIKSAFDPNNRLNPGKICTPYESAEQLVSVDGVKRAHYDKQIPIKIKNQFETTTNCNGNGLCFNYDVNSPMCPSYKATKDRRFSPKGRAALMREWLRLQGSRTPDKSQRVTNSFLTPPMKLLRTAASKFGRYDFNHEVKESMDACLACKACTTACPIKVDVPTFRSQFIEAYHGRYLRPLSDYLVANVEKVLPWLSKAPKLSNFFALNPISSAVTRNLFGYVDAPKFSKTLRQLLPKSAFYSESVISSLTPEQKERSVFLVQDPFTSSYESELVVDTYQALSKMGFTVFILPFKANGKPAHVKGFLKGFKKIAQRSTTFFNRVAEHDIPLIGLDASLVFAYRDEYVKALGAENVNFEVKLLSEWLVNQSLESITEIKASSNKNYVLLNHCTEKALLTGVEKHWSSIYSQLGLSITAKGSGCCGMAGTFGHELKNQAVSRELYDLSWRDKVAQFGEEELLATGFSCRCQVKRMDKAKLLHPIQVIAKLL